VEAAGGVIVRDLRGEIRAFGADGQSILEGNIRLLLQKLIAQKFVMAGLVPAIHALPLIEERRGCPAQGRA
jgi:hypothetical protein